MFEEKKKRLKEYQISNINIKYQISNISNIFYVNKSVLQNCYRKDIFFIKNNNKSLECMAPFGHT